MCLVLTNVGNQLCAAGLLLVYMWVISPPIASLSLLASLHRESHVCIEEELADILYQPYAW